MASDLLTRLREARELTPELFGEAVVAAGCGIGRDGPTEWDVHLLRLAKLGAWESAAVALCKRVLPGWRWCVESVHPDDETKALACVVKPGNRYTEEWVEVMAPTPTLALVRAILRAKEQTNDK